MQSHLADTCFRKQSAKHCRLHEKELEVFQNWHCFIFVWKLSVLTLLTNLHLSPFLLFIKTEACKHIQQEGRKRNWTFLRSKPLQRSRWPVVMPCKHDRSPPWGCVLSFSWCTMKPTCKTPLWKSFLPKTLSFLWLRRSPELNHHHPASPYLARRAHTNARLQLLKLSATTLMLLWVQKWAEEQKWDRTHTSTRKNWKESHWYSLLCPGPKKPEASHYKGYLWSPFSLSARLCLVMTQQHWPQCGNLLLDKLPSTEVQGWQDLWC